ncbi:MAG: response regulator transcription factor [Peptococcaceae bacterium]
MTIKRESPGVKIAIFYSKINKDFINSLQDYISAFLSREVSADEFINAVKRIHKGEKFIDSFISQQLLFNNSEDKYNEIEVLLTVQEKKVLQYLIKGKTNKEIAKEMYLSSSTIRSYVSSILRKLNIPNRAAAAAFASQLWRIEKQD